MGLLEAIPACRQQSLGCWRPFIDTGVPIQEREQWADNYFEQVDEKQDAWLTIPFVRLL